ncbi:unnamed protein product [Knipowitschia caucasica]
MPILTKETSADKQEFPKIPVPPLDQTLATYLKCVQHLVPEDQFRKTSAAVERFGSSGGVGELLQRKLQERRDQKDNWVYDYWLEDMYLNNRLALPVNSSPAMVFPKQNFRDTRDALRFATRIIRGVLDYKARIDAEDLPVDVARGQLAGTPMCMQQYRRLFSSYRYPHQNQDSLSVKVDCAGPEHMVVACKNQFFVLETLLNDEPMTDAEIFSQLDKIMKLAEEQRAPPVGLMTSDGRDQWAEARDTLLTDPVNRTSLDLLESSLCLVCLDEPCGALDQNDSSRAASMLHGGGSQRNGGNRWYDKSMQFVVGLNGVCGVVCEHSPFEGIVLVQCSEFLLKYIIGSPSKMSTVVSGKSLPVPKRLEWKISPQIPGFISASAARLNRLVKNLDMDVFRFTAYGKDFIKKQKMSPDAYIQVALQLAFYKCNRRLVPTYESASMRRFREGRVDNIRSATKQVLAFVQCMSQSTSQERAADDTEKMQKLKDAIRTQTDNTIAAITGNGIDNHLLGLLQVSRDLKMEKPELFCDQTYVTSNQFILSTSQVPTTVDMFCCYGPVVPNGYGACYNPQSDHIVFCVSSFRESTETSSAVFSTALKEALSQIRALCVRAHQPSPSPAQKPSPSPAHKPSPSPAEKPSPSPAHKPSPSPANKPNPSPANKPNPSPVNKPRPAQGPRK